MPIAVLGQSILANLSSSSRLELFVVDMGFTPQTRERLSRSWQDDRLTLHWLHVDSAALSHLPVWGRMSIATYQRLLMGTLLPPRIEKVIWLDGDAVVMADLGQLWNVPLDGKALAAAQDLVVPTFGSKFGVGSFQQLGLPPETPHFNAGVMLVDVNAWRRDHVAEQSMEYLAAHAKEVWFWDQEALNVVLLNKWKLLDPRWNQIASVAGRGFFRPTHLDARAYREVAESPWLVHWAGSIKPWKFWSSRKQNRQWYEYLDQTDWRGWRPPRSLESVGLGLYAGGLRNLMYPLESLVLRYQRWRGR